MASARLRPPSPSFLPLRSPTVAPFRLLICGLALGLLGAPAVAQAQSSGGVKVQVDAQQFNISRTEQRSSGEYPDWINREDCVNDDLVNPGAGTSIDITPNLGETGSRLGFEVWISQGTDCTSSEERGTNAINCWNVLKTVPRVNNETYRISPRAVLAERDGSFSVMLPPGRHEIIVRAPGYRDLPAAVGL